MSAVRAGQAFVEFLLDDKQLKKGLASVGDKLKKFGTIGAAATAPIVGALTGAVAAFTSAGDELAKMSQRTGFSVEALSELRFAADQSGISLDIMERAVKKMQLGMFDAQNETGTLHEAMGALGVDISKIRNLSPEKQFAALSTAISAVEDPTLKAALAQKVFGKAGTELLPMLSAGENGVNALRQKARELGLTMSDESAQAAVELGDALSAAKDQLFQMGVEIGAAVAGPLTNFLQGVHKVLGGIIAWVRENPRMVRAIAAVATGIAAASTAAIALGTVLAIISAHPIIAALTAIAALVIAIATYFGFASDGADEFSSKLDELKQESGLSSGDSSSRTAQAQAVQEQLAAAVAQSTPSVSQSSVASAEQLLAKQALEEISRYTEGTMNYVRDLVSLVRNGQAGGILVGTG